MSPLLERQPCHGILAYAYICGEILPISMYLSDQMSCHVGQEDGVTDLRMWALHMPCDTVVRPETKSWKLGCRSLPGIVFDPCILQVDTVLRTAVSHSVCDATEMRRVRMRDVGETTNED